MCQLEQNRKLAATFPGLIYTKRKRNYNTRSARKKLLDILLCQSFTYRMQSYKYQWIKDSNRFKKENSTKNLTYPVVKNIFKNYVLAFYQYFFIQTFFYITLLVTFLQNQQRKKCNVLFTYSSESSESSDYSCNFCQHKSRI